MGLEATLVFFLKVALVATLSIAAHAITRKPKPTLRADKNYLTIREPDSPRRIVYGRRRVGTIIADIAPSRDARTIEEINLNSVEVAHPPVGTPNRNLIRGGRLERLHIPAILCEGPIEGIDDIYVGDKLVRTSAAEGTRYPVRVDPYIVEENENYSYLLITPFFGALDQKIWPAFNPRVFGGDQRISSYETVYTIRQLAERYAYYDLNFDFSKNQHGVSRVQDGVLVTNCIPIPLPVVGPGFTDSGFAYIRKFDYRTLLYAYLPHPDGPDVLYNQYLDSFQNYARGIEIETTRGWRQVMTKLLPGRRSGEDVLVYHFYAWDILGTRSGKPADESTHVFLEKGVRFDDNPGDTKYPLWFDHTVPALVYHKFYQRFYRYDQATNSYIFWKFIDGSTEAEGLDYSFYDDHTVAQPYANRIIRKRFSALGGVNFHHDTPYLQGVAYLGLELIYNEEAYRQGLPDFSAVVKGRNTIYDPRNGGSTKWSSNPALCLADYMMDEHFGLGLTIDDFGNLEEAANECDEVITTISGFRRPLYEIHAIIETTSTHATIIQQILDTMAGSLSFVDGKWFIYPGIYRAPNANTFVITEDMIVAPINRRLASPRRDSANTIQGTFPDANSEYQPVSYATQKDDEAIKRDKQIVARTLDLDFVSSHEQAQRLAKIRLQQALHSQSLTLTLDARAFQITAGDIVLVNVPRIGLSNAEYQIERTTLSFGESGELTIQAELREYSAAIFAWEASEELPLPSAPKIDDSQENPEPNIVEPNVEDDTITTPCEQKFEEYRAQGIPTTCNAPPEGCDVAQWISLIEQDGTIKDEPEENVEDRNQT